MFSRALIATVKPKAVIASSPTLPETTRRYITTGFYKSSPNMAFRYLFLRFIYIIYPAIIKRRVNAVIAVISLWKRRKPLETLGFSYDGIFLNAVIMPSCVVICRHKCRHAANPHEYRVFTGMEVSWRQWRHFTHLLMKPVEYIFLVFRSCIKTVDY